MANSHSNDDLLQLLHLYKENFWLDNVHLPPDQIQSLWSRRTAEFHPVLSPSSPMSRVLSMQGTAEGSTLRSLPMSKSLTVCHTH